ncbi:hypothetical protein [Microbispora sp. GKU 823]|uniref:hypothetical protein n=1 Tax=Microbispora sp. GKU 823 TaxID=1652100 RepID=UPI0009A37D05|nr:hypothetical protein [Microbispora sp. GKU 823]OPG05801.1 hypothetical protein B1L11_34475 [Microbispora sp. GKU 823]
MRTRWIAAGAALTVCAVVAMALAAWSEIRVPHASDFSFPGSYKSSVLDQRGTETRTVTYAVTTSRIIVDVRGRVDVRVAPGVPGRLSVKRETTWHGGPPSMSETWESGKTLRVEVTCSRDLGPVDADCRTVYTVSAPPGVGVLVMTPDWTMPCPPTASEVTCGSASRESSSGSTR